MSKLLIYQIIQQVHDEMKKTLERYPPQRRHDPETPISLAIYMTYSCFEDCMQEIRKDGGVGPHAYEFYDRGTIADFPVYRLYGESEKGFMGCANQKPILHKPYEVVNLNPYMEPAKVPITYEGEWEWPV